MCPLRGAREGGSRVFRGARHTLEAPSEAPSSPRRHPRRYPRTSLRSPSLLRLYSVSRARGVARGVSRGLEARPRVPRGSSEGVPSPSEAPSEPPSEGAPRTLASPLKTARGSLAHPQQFSLLASAPGDHIDLFPRASCATERARGRRRTKRNGSKRSMWSPGAEANVRARGDYIVFRGGLEPVRGGSEVF